LGIVKALGYDAGKPLNPEVASEREREVERQKNGDGIGEQ
jgi:hypothetical protein